tara:strand:+ start:1011 stop:1391 length:381 start_codon:yes stop_codon:yes gene_type:complete
MEHYKIVEHFDAEVDTDWTSFEIQPTVREIRSVPILAGTLSALWIFCDSKVSANTLTVRVTEDEDGDKCIIGDTQVGLALGITTPSKTSSVIKIEIDVADTWPSKVWVKTDTGTVNVRQIKITWRV